MSLTNAQNESACAAVLTLLYPRYLVQGDAIQCTMDEAQAIAILDALITAAEVGGIDSDLEPVLRLLIAKATTHGPLAGAIAALRTRSLALCPAGDAVHDPGLQVAPYAHAVSR